MDSPWSLSRPSRNGLPGVLEDPAASPRRVGRSAVGLVALYRF